MCGCMVAQVKVHMCGLGMSTHRLNNSPVCDDSAAEGDMRKCGTIYR